MMTRRDLARTLTLAATLVFGVCQLCAAQVAPGSRNYVPPANPVKLSPQALVTLSRAKTAALIAVDVTRATIVSRDDKKKDIVLVIAGGIPGSPVGKVVDKFREQLEKRVK